MIFNGEFSRLPLMLGYQQFLCCLLLSSKTFLYELWSEDEKCRYIGRYNKGARGLEGRSRDSTNATWLSSESCMMEGSVKLKKIKNQIGIGHSHAVEVEEKCLKETYVVMNIISMLLMCLKPCVVKGKLSLVQVQKWIDLLLKEAVLGLILWHACTCEIFLMAQYDPHTSGL